MEIEQIKKEIKDFENESIDITDDLRFNQKDLIKRIIYYYNSKFIKGQYDDQGDRKFFFNIVRNPCDVCTKAIDFDTKNINILTAKGGTELKTWFLERDLKFWMKDQRFGKVLNRIFHELPIFGSVVTKVIDGKVYFVDLRNFAVQQDADTLNQASYIIETHVYNPLEFKRIAKEKGWENWEDVLEEKEIKIYERYGEDDNLDYRRTIISDGGTELANDIIEQHPYWEFHLDKMSGRWLGVGKIELVLDPQIRINQIANQQVKSSYWSSLRLWQTRDTGTNRNLLTDVVNGQVLQGEDPITQVDMADRNLSFYQTEINRWLSNKDEITFSHEVTRGERLPAGTPLGSAELAAGMAGAYFGQIQENIALDVKEFLFKVIIPQFLKENNTKHTLRLVGDDLGTYHRMLISCKTNNEIFKYIAKGNGAPSSDQLELMKGVISEKVKKGKEKLIDLPKDFYKDLKYKIDINITGEQMDVRSRAANKLAALQAITADPTLLTDPRKRKFFRSWLEDGGLRLEDFDTEEEPQLNQVIQKGSGGGVSKPTMPTSPVSGTKEQRL